MDTTTFRCAACEATSDAPAAVCASAVFPEIAYYRCGSCRTVQASPLPSASAVDEFYRKLYVARDLRHPLLRLLEPFRTLSERARARSLIRAVFRSGWRPGHRPVVVDCGAGNGALTCSLRAALGGRARILSIDAAEEVARLSRVADATWCLPEHELVRRLAGELDWQFDLVCFAHVLEHFRDPAGVLRGFLRHRAPGGLVVVEYPRGDHPVYGASQKVGVPDFFFFTPAGMQCLAARAGYRVATDQGLSPGPGLLLSSGSTWGQCLAAGSLVLKERLTGDGYFRSPAPVWGRAVLR